MRHALFALTSTLECLSAIAQQPPTNPQDPHKSSKEETDGPKHLLNQTMPSLANANTYSSQSPVNAKLFFNKTSLLY